MKGALIDTEARRILNSGIYECKKETAIRMLKDRELTLDKIARYSGLEISEVEQLAALQKDEKSVDKQS